MNGLRADLMCSGQFFTLDFFSSDTPVLLPPERRLQMEGSINGL